MFRHGFPHDSQTDESDVCHDFFPLVCCCAFCKIPAPCCPAFPSGSAAPAPLSLSGSKRWFLLAEAYQKEAGLSSANDDMIV
jgi:hypothetical protein